MLYQAKNYFFQNQYCLQGNEMKSSKIKKTVIQPKTPACNRRIRRDAAGKHLNKELQELGCQKGYCYMAIIY